MKTKNYVSVVLVSVCLSIFGCKSRMCQCEVDAHIEVPKTIILAPLIEDCFIRVKTGEINGAIIPEEIVESWQNDIREGRGESHGIQNIIGVKSDEFWTPTTNDIANVEAMLKQALQYGLSNPSSLDKYASEWRNRYVVDHLERIIANYTLFDRQYIGLIIKGERYIYLNSFPNSDDSSYADSFVSVCDGGFWYWRIIYNVKKKKFQQLSINGSA